jgi:predicted RNA-binding Zn-ribbon protein involved in translation (DUF1610 family)
MILGVPDWVCRSCGNMFKPLVGEGEFSFNCPNCDSLNTVPNRITSSEFVSEEEK